MSKRGVNEGINKPKIRQILLVFSTPKTPRQAEIKLSVKKLKLKPFLEKDLLKCLNPGARKGRFYVLSEKARKYLGIDFPESNINKDWELIGWITASPKQRLAVLRCLDENKFTSENIRMRATILNSCLSRTSTKSILKELIEKGLADSENHGRIRLYWITSRGRKIRDEMATIYPLSPLFS